MAQLEGEAVGEAARLARLLLGQRAAGQRHAEVSPVLDRRVGGPGDLHFGFVRKRARCAGKRVAKAVERRLLGHSG